MTREDLVKNLRFKFSGVIIDLVVKSPKRVYVEVGANNILEVSEYLFRDLGARFITATGMELSTHMEVLYHFSADDLNVIISLRTTLDGETPVIDSLTSLFDAANWVEREMHELLGIEFRGHPDMRRLLLPEDWPEETYPLRHDYHEWDQDAV